MRLTATQRRLVLVSLTIVYIALDIVLLYYGLLSFFVLVVLILTFVIAVNITRKMATSSREHPDANY